MWSACLSLTCEPDFDEQSSRLSLSGCTLKTGLLFRENQHRVTQIDLLRSELISGCRCFIMTATITLVILSVKFLTLQDNQIKIFKNLQIDRSIIGNIAPLHYQRIKGQLKGQMKSQPSLIVEFLSWLNKITEATCCADIRPLLSVA